MHRGSTSNADGFWASVWTALWQDQSYSGRRVRGKMIQAIVLGYFLVLIVGLPELWFRWSGELVIAQVEYVRQDSQGRWHVAWMLESPESGNLVRDQAIVDEANVPRGQTIDVQFVDGIVPMSRPVAEANPAWGWVFLIVQFSPLILLGAFAVHIARECHRPMLTRQQRIVRQYQRRRAFARRLHLTNRE